ncbi:L,D-transpeptidase [Streptomyces sp. NPDC005728]|uniref:L,D-transpeptidase n=1 Tax=Streptomyces sp. NPDC005728 TaxID=3157054 RepID=UPI0033D456D8
MSDDRGYDAGPDGTGHPAELSGALHTLAEDHQVAPPVPGAEIRRLALRRGRRRRTAVVIAGVAAAAAVAVTSAVGPGHDSDSGRRTTPATGNSLRPGPATTAPPATAAPPAPTASPATADAVVDLTKMTMTVDGRALPVSPGVPKQPTPTGRFTVTGKYQVRPLKTGTDVGGSGSGGVKEVTVPWVIELLSVDTRRANFVIALTYAPKAPGNYATTSGWIGLREADAKWLYTRLDKGSVVLVTGRTPMVGTSMTRP